MRELSYYDRGSSRFEIERSRRADGDDLALSNPVFVEDPQNPLWDYGFKLRKHRRLVAIFVIGSTLTCAIAVFLLITPKYVAETTLLIERNPPQVLEQQNLILPEPLMPDEHDFYKTQNEILTSRNLAAEV